MWIKEADLTEFRAPLEDSLIDYEPELGGIEFQDFPDLTLTPDKPNSARTVVPVTYAGSKVGDLYVIVFDYQDGTGDQSSYKLDDVVIPSEFQVGTMPERVIPRAKTGVVAEAFFPLFSRCPQGRVVPFAASLTELMLDEQNQVFPAFQLGQNLSAYAQAIRSNAQVSPVIEATTGTDVCGQRFGDPHAVYCARPVEDFVQVVGFLSCTDASSPLMAVFGTAAMKPLPFR